MSAAFRVRRADWAADQAALAAIRHAVFVVELQVPAALERDGIDADCAHALAEDRAGDAIGCGRLLPDGQIGRLAVVREWRRRGVGARLLLALVALARERGHDSVRLNAQSLAVPFYARHGFTPCGAEYEEAGIRHRAMERRLR